MNIGLIGTGRMGQEVMRIAGEMEHEIAAAFDEGNRLSPAGAEGCDVLIDFSIADAVPGHVSCALEADRPLVIGTTGWHDNLAQVRDQVQRRGGAVLHAPNFSIGVALFREVVRRAGELFGSTPDYDAALHEAHHRGKADSPSGTARLLADTLLPLIDGKTHALSGQPDGRIPPEALQVISLRLGHVPGTHVVTFDSADDSIELRHSARGRTGFARGAIRAAEWLRGRTGFFSLEDMLAEVMEPSKFPG